MTNTVSEEINNTGEVSLEIPERVFDKRRKIETDEDLLEICSDLDFDD